MQIINACLLSSAWSAASSDLYTSSRAICMFSTTLDRNVWLTTWSTDGLAVSGNAPKIFARTSKSGLPYVSVIFCASFTLLAFMAVSSGAGVVFGWFSNMTSVAGLVTWFGISVTYIRFYKGLQAQGIDRRTFPYWTRGQPYTAWYGAIGTFLVSMVCLVCPFCCDTCLTRP